MNPDSSENKKLTYRNYSLHIHQIIHFENIQAAFRLFASSGFLGCFAAIGFLLSSSDMMPFYQRVSSVVFVGGVGISALFSFWYLDLVFYERLFVSSFAEALRIENNYKWMPRIHHNMLSELNNLEKRTNVSYYYIGSILSVVLSTGIVLLVLFFEYSLIVSVSICFVDLFIFFCVYCFIKIKTKKIKDLLKVLGVQ